MANGYDHVQYGFIHYIVALGGAGCFAAALLSGADSLQFITLIAAAGAMMAAGGCFVYLRVSDCGDSLGIRFGPLSLFGTSIRYDNMASAEVSRTTFLHGWGIHGIPFWSVTYNIRGYDCVRVTLKRRHGVFRFSCINIGTDDAAGLASFLSSKIASRVGSSVPNESEGSRSRCFLL
jgi:hypothetical protein